MSQEEIDAASAALGGGVPAQDAGNGTDAPSGGPQPEVDHGHDDSDAAPAKGGKEKTLIIVAVALLLIIFAAVGLILLNQGNEKRSAQQEIQTGSQAIEETDSNTLKSFMTHYGDGMNKAEHRISDMELSLKAVTDQTAALADQMARNTREQNDKIDQILAALKTGGGKPDAKAPAPNPDKPETKAAIEQILREFERRMVSLELEPRQAREAATTRLQTLNIDPTTIQNLLAASAQKAGRYYIGDVKEAYPTVEDVSKELPKKLAEMMPVTVQLLAGLARDNGKLLPAMCYDDVYNLVRKRFAFTPDEKELLTKENISKLCVLSRIRRENIDDNEMDYIPFLVQKMRSMGVPRDRVEICKFLWTQRESLPPSMTPGKMVTMMEVLARAINNTTDPEIQKGQGLDTGFRSMTGQDADLAIGATKTAIRQATARGRNEKEAKAAGSRALTEHLETARITATDELRANIVKTAWADVQEESRIGTNKPASTSPGGGPNVEAPRQTQAKSDVSPIRQAASDYGLTMGPLVIRRATITAAVGWMAPGLLKMLEVDAGSQEGVAMTVAAVQQAPRLVDALVNAGGLTSSGDIRTGLLPQVIQAMRTMQPLAKIDIKVSTDPALNDSRNGRAFRGAILGTAYGPFLHDMTKATDLGKEALIRVEQNPPLTASIAQSIAAAGVDKPYATAITAINAYAPGIVPYQPQRFQDLAAFSMDRQAAASSYVNAIAPAFAKDRDDTLGRFSDLLRVFIPLSIATRDDGTTSIETVKKIVNDDIEMYATMYAAEFIASTRILQETIPNFAMSVSDEVGGPTKLIQVASQEVPGTIARFVLDRHLTVTPSTILSTARAIAAEVFPVVEKRLARETVMSRVEPRIRRGNPLASQADVAEVLAYAERETDNLVIAPYTPANLDEWAGEITQRARSRMADPQAKGTANSGPGMNSAPGGKGVTKALVKLNAVTGQKTGKLTGSEKDMVKTKKITIPAFSRCQAHLLNGADPEFGGGGGGGGGGGAESDPVYLNVASPWICPDGQSIFLPKMKISSKAKARAGASRVTLSLTSFSMVFPSKLTLFADCAGDVFDPQDGHLGITGAWNLNIDKVAPLAMVVGGGKGISEAMKANNSTSVVGTNGIATTANTGSQLQTAILGGVGGAADILTGKVEAILKDVNSTVSIDNGVLADIVISKPIIFDVPEKEFEEYIRMTRSGTFNAR